MKEWKTIYAEYTEAKNCDQYKENQAFEGELRKMYYNAAAGYMRPFEEIRNSTFEFSMHGLKLNYNGKCVYSHSSSPDAVIDCQVYANFRKVLDSYVLGAIGCYLMNYAHRAEFSSDIFRAVYADFENLVKATDETFFAEFRAAAKETREKQESITEVLHNYRVAISTPDRLMQDTLKAWFEQEGLKAGAKILYKDSLRWNNSGIIQNSKPGRDGDTLIYLEDGRRTRASKVNKKESFRLNNPDYSL